MRNTAKGSVFNFVSMVFCLIPEVGCGQSPRSLINIEDSGNILCWKSEENRISKTQNELHLQQKGILYLQFYDAFSLIVSLILTVLFLHTR